MQGGKGARSGSADPYLCEEEAGGERQPRFPSGAEMGTFHFHSALAVYDREQVAAVGKEAQRDPGAAQRIQHSTSRLPGQGTDCLTRDPSTSKTTCGSMGVVLAGLCTVLLCCGPMLACCRRVTIFPSVLTFHEGGRASFSCNISMENDSGSEYSLNWYKETNHSRAQKIAEIRRNNATTKAEKYQVTNHTPVFRIDILNLHQNDSGSYYCGLIAFFEPDKVMESERSQLMVTAAPEMTATEEPDIEEGDPSNHIKAMLLGILLLAGVIVLLIFGYLTITYRRGDVQKPPCENMPVKEEKPPMVSVSTVDYGVLEFQRDQRTQVPPETWPVDQTEYATIIFPEEKPVMPERGKKHQDERTRKLHSQTC